MSLGSRLTFCVELTMCWKNLLALLAGLGLLICAGNSASSQVRNETSRSSQSPRRAGLRYELNPAVAPYFGKIEKLSKDGTLTISPAADIPLPPVTMRIDLVEGYYLGVVQKTLHSSLAGARLFRAEVQEVLDEGQVRVQAAPAAVEVLKADEFIMLFRPLGATTAQMKQLPEVASIEESGGAGTPDGEQALLSKSFQNLKQIGLALHNYHDTHGRFPPAVLLGPDGKPWHSWRVLILPYIEQAELYNQYHFDEPWDGPRNSKLLEKIPGVYTDPIHGENPGHYTNYAAICGEAMAFDSEGVEFDGENVPFDGGRWMAEFTDGTSNTLMIAPVSPDLEIPWLKPADVTVEDSVPPLGKKGSFPLPYQIGSARVAPFLRCDGSVVGLKEMTDPQMLYAALTRGGGEPLSWEKFPTVRVRSGAQEIPVIYVEKKETGVSVRLLLEAAPAD